MTHITYQLALMRHDELRRQAAEHRRQIDPPGVAGDAVSRLAARRRRRVPRLVRLRLVVRGRA